MRVLLIDLASVVLLALSVGCKQETGMTQPVKKELFVGQVVEEAHLYAPLSRTLRFQTEEATSIMMRVVGKNGKHSDVSHTFPGQATEHEIVVHGLYPGFSNSVELIAESSNKQFRDTMLVRILTAQIPEGYFPEVSIERAYHEEMDGQWTFVSHRSHYDPNIPFMIDAFGDIRWYIDYSEHPDLNRLFYDVGMERLQNGNLYFGSGDVDKILEVDMTGEIVNEWHLTGYNFHHTVQEKPDGNFLVTLTKYGSEHLNGQMTIEDYVAEIDRSTGDIVMEWDLKESLNEWRTTHVDNLGQYYIDWIHINAVIYDPKDTTIIVSGRHQGLVKLDYTNQVKWILGPHLDWGISRRGDTLDQYLLAPLDGSGNPLSDESVLNGFTRTNDFEWNWYQHAPTLTREGTIMLFDNGDNRQWGTGGGYSRAVEYQIDDEAMTVQQLWDYGKDHPETFSPIVSDVDQLENSDHVLFNPGHIVNGSSGRIEGRVIEVDYATKQVLFDMRLICAPGKGITFHRAEKMSLYP